MLKHKQLSQLRLESVTIIISLGSLVQRAKILLFTLTFPRNNFPHKKFMIPGNIFSPELKRQALLDQLHTSPGLNLCIKRI